MRKSEHASTSASRQLYDWDPFSLELQHDDSAMLGRSAVDR